MCARLTFILTWRNALLLFRICNLCYYGRVVHGNEMLMHLRLHRFLLLFCLFVCFFFIPWKTLPKRTTTVSQSFTPPQPPRGCARGYRAASSVCTIKIPFFSSEHAVPIRFTSTGEMSARSSRRRRRRRRGRNIWGDSPTKRLNKASVLRSSRVCPLWLLQAA